MKTFYWSQAEAGAAKPFLRYIISFLKVGVFHRCPICGSKMSRQNELALYLTEGQKCEQTLGTIGHSLWKCSDCSETVLTASRTLRGRSYCNCPDCGYLTLRKRVTTVALPTHYWPGKRLVEQDCANCFHHFTRYDEINQIAVPSSLHRPAEDFHGFYGRDGSIRWLGKWRD